MFDLRTMFADFFTINDVIVQFVHGQVFLVLGIIMWTQWRQRSQLELARALPWLAAFGVFEAVATWGNIFIPIQKQLLSSNTIEFLLILQLVVYLLTYCALMGFGLKLNESVVPSRLVWAMPVILGCVGVVVLLLQLLTGKQPMSVGNIIIEVLFRYIVAFPAALLVAAGLRQQAAHLLGPLNLQPIYNSLRVAGFAFLFYAVVEGVLAPSVDGFPSIWLSDRLFFDLLGIPIGVFRAITGVVISWFFIRALDVFRIEADRLSKNLEHQQSLVDERERISRDLHDGTIQSIYAVGLMLQGIDGNIQNAAKHAEPHLADLRRNLNLAHTQMQTVFTMINRAIQDVRSYIYDLRSQSADEDLARGLIEIVSEFRMRTGMTTEWRTEGTPEWTLTPDRRLHVYQIMREALSNAMRHAQATQINIDLFYGNIIQLVISDNGNGKLPQRSVLGRGLNNMRERAKLINGDLNIQANPGSGTKIVLTIQPNIQTM